MPTAWSDLIAPTLGEWIKDAYDSNVNSKLYAGGRRSGKTAAWAAQAQALAMGSSEILKRQGTTFVSEVAPAYVSPADAVIDDVIAKLKRGEY